MKIVEKKANETIACPFCDSPLRSSLTRRASRVCPHTLLVTDDEQVWFERDNLSLASLQEDSLCSWAHNKKEDSQVVMIKTYGPAPLFFGEYYLFKG